MSLTITCKRLIQVPVMAQVGLWGLHVVARGQALEPYLLCEHWLLRHPASSWRNQ